MALTGEDFQKIETLVTNAVTNAVSGLATNEALLATKDELKQDLREAQLATRADLHGVERRLKAAILAADLIERDSEDRLDDHERRIAQLEQAKAN